MPATVQQVQRLAAALDATGVVNLDKSLRDTLNVPGIQDVVAADITAEWYIAGGSGWALVIRQSAVAPTGPTATP